MNHIKERGSENHYGTRENPVETGKEVGEENIHIFSKPLGLLDGVSMCL